MIDRHSVEIAYLALGDVLIGASLGRHCRSRGHGLLRQIYMRG